MNALPSYWMENGESNFTIDWPLLREIATEYAFGRQDKRVRKHHSRMSRWTTAGDWHGYTNTDLRNWLTTGFRTDNLGIEVVPPVREKRRYRYFEEAEELHVDRALSGDDNYMGEFTKRKIIPGVSVIVEVDFSAMTNAKVVNEYNVFVCQCLQSLDSSGIDAEITYRHSAVDLLPGLGRGKHAHTSVRVKKENEAIDFGAFSPMLSPAAFRTFMFFAMALHAEVRNENASEGMGRGRQPSRSKFSVTKTEDGHIVFDCPRTPTTFPKSNMEAEFALALGLIGD